MKDKFLSSKTWKLLRQAVLRRDQHRCFLCGGVEGLVVHHILYRRFHKELQEDPLNLITLCRRCHYCVHRQDATIKLIAKLLKEHKNDIERLLEHCL